MRKLIGLFIFAFAPLTAFAKALPRSFPVGVPAATVSCKSENDPLPFAVNPLVIEFMSSNGLALDGFRGSGQVFLPNPLTNDGLRHSMKDGILHSFMTSGKIRRLRGTSALNFPGCVFETDGMIRLGSRSVSLNSIRVYPGLNSRPVQLYTSDHNHIYQATECDLNNSGFFGIVVNLCQSQK